MSEMTFEQIAHEGLTPTKVRAVLYNSKGEVLYTAYNEDDSRQATMMLPGGKIDPGDASPADALIREVQEESGLILPANRVTPLSTVALRAQNYLTREGTIRLNHTVITRYFSASIEGLEVGERKLTDAEKAGRCVIKNAGVYEILRLSEELPSNNPRWPFFREEMQLALSMYLEKRA